MERIDLLKISHPLDFANTVATIPWGKRDLPISWCLLRFLTVDNEFLYRWVETARVQEFMQMALTNVHTWEKSVKLPKAEEVTDFMSIAPSDIPSNFILRNRLKKLARRVQKNLYAVRTNEGMQRVLCVGEVNWDQLATFPFAGSGLVYYKEVQSVSIFAENEAFLCGEHAYFWRTAENGQPEIRELSFIPSAAIVQQLAKSCIQCLDNIKGSDSHDLTIFTLVQTTGSNGEHKLYWRMLWHNQEIIFSVCSTKFYGLQMPKRINGLTLAKGDIVEIGTQEYMYCNVKGEQFLLEWQ